MTVAIPLAVVATLLTIGCSVYLLELNQIDLDLGTHFAVTEVGESKPLGVRGVHVPLQRSQLPAEAVAAVAAPVSTPAASASVAAAAAPAAATAVATAVAPVAAAALPAAMQPSDPRFFEGHFLFASPSATAGLDAPQLRRLLKSLLGMAVLLKRTLVLPAEICDCATEGGLDPKQELRAPAASCAAAPGPFGCALRLQLPLDKWIADKRVEFRPAALLRGPFPEEVARSHCRLLLPDGMDDSELGFALRMYKDTRLLEVDHTDPPHAQADPPAATRERRALTPLSLRHPFLCGC